MYMGTHTWAGQSAVILPGPHLLGHRPHQTHLVRTMAWKQPLHPYPHCFCTQGPASTKVRGWSTAMQNPSCGRIFMLKLSPEATASLLTIGSLSWEQWLCVCHLVACLMWAWGQVLSLGASEFSLFPKAAHIPAWG